MALDQSKLQEQGTAALHFNSLCLLSVTKECKKSQEGKIHSRFCSKNQIW